MYVEPNQNAKHLILTMQHDAFGCVDVLGWSKHMAHDEPGGLTVNYKFNACVCVFQLISVFFFLSFFRAFYSIWYKFAIQTTD